MHHVWFLTYQIKKNCFYVMTCSLFQIVKNLIIGLKRKEVLMTEINAKIMRFFFLNLFQLFVAIKILHHSKSNVKY